MIFKHITLFQSLLDAQTTYGNAAAIVEDIERTPLNYSQFIRRCFILGRAISRSTKSGEYVGILLPNMTSAIVTFFALQAYGRVPTMLNFAAGKRNILLACETAQIKTIYSSRRFINNAGLSQTSEALNQAGINIIYLEDLRGVISFGDKLVGLIESYFPQYAYNHIINANKKKQNQEAKKPAVILFTSGSEGAPKAVVLSHLNIQANRCQLASIIDFGPTDIIFNALPIFHSFGLTGGTLLPILSGAKVFFYPSPLHYRIIPKLVYDTSATIMFGTDTFLSGYAKYAQPSDFFSLRYVFAGAEKLREITSKTWIEKYNVKILEGYGTTETSPILAVNTPIHSKPGTVGRLIPGVEYTLKKVPGINDGGRLIVSGANIMLGYMLHDNPGHFISPINGRYDTGDIVSVDSEGYVTIKGRAKRFAKIAGEMVSLSAVEQCLDLLWPDHLHAVISIPDEKRGEQLVLVTNFLEANRKTIIQYVQSNRMEKLSIPKRIIIAEQMPLLAIGKIDYISIKEMVEKTKL